MWTRQSFQASEKAPVAILQAATAALELNHRASGTHAGIELDGATLVWADTNRYCVEAQGYYVAGPGGTPTVGACPR